MRDVKKIRDMRKWLDTTDGLSPATRRTAEAAVQRVSDEWKAKHKDRYDSAVAARDTRYKTMARRASRESVAELKQLVIDMRAGRVSVRDARGRLRDYMTEHNRLTELHNAVMHNEAKLEVFAAQEPEDYQEEMLRRFPPMDRVTPDLAHLVEEQAKDDQVSERWFRGRIADHTEAPSEADLRNAG
jgi:hypothetical protein